jgi:Flp pilus assembly protein TadD
MNDSFRRPVVGWTALFLFTYVAYVPALFGGFVWDDDQYVTHNPTLTDLSGLQRIWFAPRATPQYYPLVFTTFWAERHAWGLHPVGYHLVNIGLHALNAALLWRILRRLGVPGAWFAGALFALHPVHVESVAWITERKNVLSTLFYLAAGLTFLRLHRIGEPSVQDATLAPGRRDRGLYWTMFLLFLGALASKTVTCTWPAAALLVLWWKRGWVERRDVTRLTPMFLAGLAMGLWTAWVERRYVGAEGTTWDLSALEQCQLAGRVLCFYVGKLFWPDPLVFIYPRWTIDPGDLRPWAYSAACLAVIAAVWRLRGRIGRGPIVAVLYFVGTLVPALGFFRVYFMQFSFVADHFQYLASIGPIALFAACASRWNGFRSARILQALVLVMLGINTWGRATTFVSPAVLWEDTLLKNPDAWIAHNNLGLLLEQEGKLDEAEGHFRRALALKPGLARVHCNLGSLLADRGDFTAAMEHFHQALHIAPDYADAWYNLATAFARQGDWPQAIEHYRQALQRRPNDADSHFGLGTALNEVGDREAAASEYLEGLRIAPDHEGARRALAAVRGGAAP